MRLNRDGQLKRAGSSSWPHHAQDSHLLVNGAGSALYIHALHHFIIPLPDITPSLPQQQITCLAQPLSLTNPGLVMLCDCTPCYHVATRWNLAEV